MVFHCTLGHVLRPQDVPRAIELARAAPLPTKTVANSFDVVECGTAKHPQSFTFGAGNTASNKPAAPNPAIASQVHSGHHGRGVGELERRADPI